MALRTWLCSLAVVVVLAAGYAAARGVSGGGRLRSEHAQPAVKVPEGRVAVTAKGKTFHHPDCRFIHGPVEMIPAAQAVAEGYAPCVRCMREALGEPAYAPSRWRLGGDFSFGGRTLASDRVPK
jgi:hypothetical protein